MNTLFDIESSGFVPGWVPDAPNRPAVAASVGPDFGDVARHLVADAPTGNVLLYKAWKDAIGAYIPYPRQEIGDCESFGHGHGNDLLQCVEIVTENPGAAGTVKREDIETDTEFLYGAGREVGGMLGNMDGCYGSAMVKAMTTVGMLPRSAVGAYSGQRAKQWGRTGPPSDLKAKAAGWKLGAAALVTTWDELVAAIANGYPVSVSSNQGFTMTRDSDGFCDAQGRWGHCMLICGIRVDKPGACIFQSWGPNVPSGPTALDQPDNSFWATQGTIQKMLAGNDSYALSKTPFFAPRPLPSHWKWHDMA